MTARISGAMALLCMGWASIALGASGFTFTKIADTSMPVPGGLFGNFTSVKLLASDRGNVAFIGSYEFQGAGYTGLYQYHAGQIATIADLSVASPTGEPFQHVLAGNDYIDKNLVFGASTASGIGIFRLDGANISTLLAPAATLPDTGGTIGLLEAGGVSGDATSAGFAGMTSTAHGVLFKHVNDQLSLVASDQTNVPGAGGRGQDLFYSFPELHTATGKRFSSPTSQTPSAASSRRFLPGSSARKATEASVRSSRARCQCQTRPTFYSTNSITRE